MQESNKEESTVNVDVSNIIERGGEQEGRIGEENRRRGEEKRKGEDK